MPPIRTASARARSDSRKTIGIARAIAVLKVDLVNTIISALHEKLLVEIEATVGLGIEFDHPTADAVRIKLLVPGSVKRVGEIDARAVAADFNHLRSAGQWPVLILRMRRAVGDAADADRGGLLRIERIGDVIVQHLASPPAGDVEESVFLFWTHFSIGAARSKALLAAPP